MSITKFLSLVIVLLISISSQSCLKKSDSNLNLSGTYTGEIPITTYFHYLSKDGNNYICQYICKGGYSTCEKYVVDVKSANIDKDVIDIIKEFSEHSDTFYQKTTSFKIVKSIVELKLSNKDEKDICKLESKKRLLSSTLLDPPLSKIISSSYFIKQINENWEKREYNDENSKNAILYNNKTGKLIIKTSSLLNYDDATKYCNERTFQLITNSEFKNLVFEDRIIKDLDFKKGECVWFYGETAAHNFCYQTNSMYTQNASSQTEHPFLCYKTLELVSWTLYTDNDEAI